MKHPERVEDYLEHIAQAIQRASEYIAHLGDVSAFSAKPTRSGCCHTQHRDHRRSRPAHSTHAPQFVTAHPELPWIEMRGMRNKMIHDYFGVDVHVVWSTVKQDLPALKKQIEHILNERTPAPPE